MLTLAQFWWEWKMVQLVWKIGWNVSTETKNETII
jgi:hypothetical protein